jgi:quinol monooxygenase YgiN
VLSGIRTEAHSGRAAAGLACTAEYRSEQQPMIHVVAIITAKPGQRDALLALFRANMPAVLAEEGCIEYGPVIDQPDFGPAQTPIGPDTFIVIEKWASPEALKAHGAAPHMVAYGKASRDLIASRIIHVLTDA